MRVPFVDVDAGTREIRQEVDGAIRRVLDSGRFILGPEVEAFEREFAAYCGVGHCVGVGNGLDALTLILRSLDVGSGDEVLVPSQTFIATWLAVASVGATPVPVDVDPETACMDPSAAAAAVTARTAAIIAVHLYGRCADMTRLATIAADHDAWLIEDSAQAHGCTWLGRRAGSLGDAAAFSFYPTKNLGALGDAGAVATDNPDVADRVRRLRNYGSKEKYRHVERGYNSRLDPIQAAVLRAKLPHLERWTARRQGIASRYAEAFGGLPGIRVIGADDLAGSVWHLFVLELGERDALAAWLAERGIETLVHYPTPPHRSPAFACHGRAHLPIADRLAARALSLPMYPQLTEVAVAAVADAVCDWARARGQSPRGGRGYV